MKTIILLFLALLCSTYFSETAGDLGDDLRREVDTVIDGTVQEVDQEVLKLIDELRKPVFNRTGMLTRDQLLAKIDDLMLNSKTVEESLAKQHQSVWADGLEKLDARLLGLDSQIRTDDQLDPGSEVGRLALEGLTAQVADEELALDREIQRINDELNRPVTAPGGNDIIGDLMKQGEKLVETAKQLVEELELKGHSVEAKALQLLEDAVIDGMQKLRDFHPILPHDRLIQQELERLLKWAEQKLDDYIHKLIPTGAQQQQQLSNDSNDIFSDLLKTCEMLVEKAKLLVEELELKGRSVEAQALTLLEDGVIDAMQKLRDYHPKSAIGRAIQRGLADALKWAETKLDDYIHKLIPTLSSATGAQQQLVVNDNSNDIIGDLMKQGEKLVETAKQLVEELELKGHTVEAKALQLLEDAVIDGMQKLRDFHPILPHDRLIQQELERLLKWAEQKLDDYIHKLIPNGAQQQLSNDSNDIFSDLLKTCEMLVEKAKLLVEELELKGRTVEAQALTLLEDGVIDGMQKLRDYHPKSAIGRAIQRGLADALKWAENKLDDYIQKLLK
ncbi:uncharacterized protein LOC128953239 [Oppia nitens]|uniref:uncharacterized protein LOC128953239 n=1 Tax=Oppia nitens TaxID=1686743 RepID=UPI0023DA1393|nr:uncharacterized protein LOC128953239 [Oppia nitens]